jgi:hypothetical protein
MRFYDLTKKTEELFEKVKEETSIPQWVDFTLVGDNKLKKLCDAQKCNEYLEYVEGSNITVYFNEDLFEKLAPEQQELCIEEELTSVSVNPDNDKIKILKTDINTHSGFLRKYDDETVIRLKESEISIFEAKKLEDEEKKPTKK